MIPAFAALAATLGLIALNFGVVAQTCLETQATGFNLQAVFVDPPATGPVSVPLNVIMINTVPLVSWDILSTATGVFTSEVLTNGGLFPMSTSQPNFRTNSLAVITGDSPTFVTTQFPPTPPQAYCITSNPFLGPNGPQLVDV
ncbi:hypothetical protein GGX14DRAFT_554335 [Mycena pura]|uniref:Uncharacterized protein n=1 Tax=Mycena pura TaxID=153505 RepID=A0AAD6YS57_9AGAR|nr:hypothetical protein GGX14DRAFT_554335 [Mycena pura]